MGKILKKGELESALIKEKKEHLDTLDDLRIMSDNYIDLQKKYMKLASNNIGYNIKK